MAAVLLHGSDTSKDSAIEKLVEAAMASGEAGKEQARMFRSAVVAGGGVPALIACLSEDMPRRQYLAASAMHALALDDPTTDADNFHQLEICQAGAVQPLVKLLDSEDLQLQQAATGALSALAENPTCQTMIAAEGAIAPLMAMASYGSDMQKLSAIGALDVLTVNNAGEADHSGASWPRPSSTVRASVPSLQYPAYGILLTVSCLTSAQACRSSCSRRERPIFSRASPRWARLCCATRPPPSARVSRILRQPR